MPLLLILSPHMRFLELDSKRNLSLSRFDSGSLTAAALDHESSRAFLFLFPDLSLSLPLSPDVTIACLRRREVKNATRCIRDYFRECATPSMKQMARTVYSGIQRRFKKTCSPTGIAKILENRECISHSRGPLLQCYNQAVKDLWTVRGSDDKKAWHPMTCCFASRSHDCALTAVKANCPGKGSEHFARESTQMMDEMMETFCPANLVWGSKECASVVSTLVDTPLPQDRQVTILPIVMDIMKEMSLPEEETI